jgi:hypothetical protein
MKIRPDVNDTLQNEGEAAVRERLDRATKYNGGGDGPTFDPRFKLKPFEAIVLSTKPSYLVKGILPRVGLAVIWGPPKCGKSFWAFDLFMHVVLGWLYRGRKVQQGPVVYLALEGGSGFKGRVEAWRRRHLSEGRAEPVPFYLLDVPVDLVADHGKLILAIQAQLGEQMPSAVVIDTLNRALLGDENKSDDMAKFVRAADAVRAAFQCLVAVVHHCGVQGSRPRGHTSLSGADDVQIAVERDKEGIIIATVEHMKDSEAGAAIASKLESVDLGRDDDGDPLTSCIVTPAVASAKGPKLSGHNLLALTVLQKLLANESQEPPPDSKITRARVCSAIKWREEFYNACPADSQTTKQKAFVRATLKLFDLNLAAISGAWAWRPDNPDKPYK